MNAEELKALKAVATALGIRLKDAKLTAEGDLDVRTDAQTLRQAPAIRVAS